MVRRRGNEKTRRYAELARRHREELVAEMGGVCARCGSSSDLEFNHLEERTWVASKQSRYHRMFLYRKDWEAGKLDLRCSDCNKRFGKPKPWLLKYQQPDSRDEEPIPD